MNSSNYTVHYSTNEVPGQSLHFIEEHSRGTIAALLLSQETKVISRTRTSYRILIVD